ncbi:MAG: RNHCP domain-containing protein [Anaerolineales bacterium]|nr:RNHCP domain-containing protein [Anaerolineales bacterium]
MSRQQDLRSRSWRGGGQGDGFDCAHCKGYVSADGLLSGVRNRNHCPYCLWSRHLDLGIAGDRLAACKAPMRPIGLTFKRARNRYASDPNGELMLIHQCAACGKLSINRIAADDLPECVLEVFAHSLALDSETRAALKRSGIMVLHLSDLDAIRARLWGAPRLEVASAWAWGIP